MQSRDNFGPYCGYDQNWRGDYDHEIAETGAGTPCGEYLRRYWHPVALARELGERPKLIKILGEALVLFRDKSNRIGLVHKNCPHRRASLEYGRCETRGIRCCYHGWLFDVDGTILEIPADPEDSQPAIKVKQTRRLGAYPVKEFRGLVFAYMGPSGEQPPFPIYDAYEIPDMVMSPYAAPFKCNWIQVLDAILDPVHTAFLHHNQFSEGFGLCGEIQFYQRDKIRFLGTATRRVNDNVWVRVNELILPNFTQSGAAFSTDGTQLRWFGRSAFTRWVVPVDDENCIAFAWGNFGERGDPVKWNTKAGMERMEQGEIIDRSYWQRQQSPGDVEATEGMGAISEHEKEYLVAGDRGIALYRRRIRRLCRDLAKGKKPPQPGDLAEGTIPTHGSDNVIYSPGVDQDDDKKQLRRVNDQVMDIIFSADKKTGRERDEYIMHQLGKLSVQ